MLQGGHKQHPLIHHLPLFLKETFSFSLTLNSQEASRTGLACHRRAPTLLDSVAQTLSSQGQCCKGKLVQLNRQKLKASKSCIEKPRETREVRRQLSACYRSMRPGAHIPRAPINAGWVWHPAYNSSPRDPQHIGW